MSDIQHYPQVARLLWVMERLRDPETGCPWDRDQSFETIVPYTIEEAYEVADAIEHGSMDDIQDELGDLLFQVVFYAQLGKEQNAFDFEAIASMVSDKLIRRHPHVFADGEAQSETELNQQWDAIKQQERADKGQDEDTSVLANVPRGMSPLMRAHKLLKRCAKVGFDWPDYHPVVDKIHEEIQEVREEAERPEVNPQALEEEVGDLLFAVVNLARHLNVDAERALRTANHKFEQRFRAVENHFDQSETPLRDATLQDMEAVWQQVKKQVDT